MMQHIIEAKIRSAGASAWRVIPAADIPFSEEVRKICEGNMCHGYGKSWACPPGVGSFEQCRQECLSYENALVFSAVYQLEDSFDFEGMGRGHREFKELCDRLGESLERPFLLLSNEGCIRCKSCTYPDAPCRFPDKLYPSLEGYGILVTELAKKARLNYNGGTNTVSYFGMLCF